jgi:hypothetical protein
MPDPDEYLIPKGLKLRPSCFFALFHPSLLPSADSGNFGPLRQFSDLQIPLKNQAKNELLSGLAHPSRSGMASLPTLQLHLHPYRGTIGPPEIASVQNAIRRSTDDERFKW